MTHTVVVALKMLLHASERIRLSCQRVTFGTQTRKRHGIIPAALTECGKLTRKHLSRRRELCRFGVISGNGAFRARTLRRQRRRRAFILGKLPLRRVSASRALVF